MAKNTLVGKLQSVFMENFLQKAVAAAVGAVAAYLVDVGLLDGEGADAFAGALLQIASNLLQLIL